MRGRGKLRSRDARGRHWDPSGPDKAEWKTDECGEGGKEHGSTWAHILAGVHCQPPHHPPLSSHHSTIAPFLHSRANLSNSLLPEERTKREEEATKEGVFASLALLPLLSSLSVIPSKHPDPSLGAIFHQCLHVCIILRRTLPIAIMRAARST